MIDIDSVEVERHEAAIWAALIEATAEFEGNPLRAEVDRTGLIILPVVAALDSIRFNRVISPEALSSNCESELIRLQAFYSEHSQTHFAVELPPTMATPRLAAGLSQRGFVDSTDRVGKVVQPVDSGKCEEVEHDVFELTPNDRDAWVAVMFAAWGVPRLMRSWFASSFAVSDFYHFGIAEDNVVVAVGAMHVAGEFAWLGFGATHPEHRGQGLQLALLAHRMRVAADLGCRWAHSESVLEAGETSNASLRNMLRAGFVHIHDRIIYEHRSGAANDDVDLIGRKAMHR